MYIFMSYLIMLVYMFRIADEQKKYETNKKLIANAPWYYTFGSSHSSYDRNDEPSLFDSPLYPLMVILAPLSLIVIGILLVSAIVYKAIFKWIPNLLSRRTTKQ